MIIYDWNAVFFVFAGPRKKIGLRASDSRNIKSKFFFSDNRALQGK